MPDLATTPTAPLLAAGLVGGFAVAQQTGVRPLGGVAMLGANAVMAAAELVCELNRIADLMIARGDASGRFDPPATTVHVGTIQGGTARNILPKVCTFHWEFRGLPDLDMAGARGAALAALRSASGQL